MAIIIINKMDSETQTLFLFLFPCADRNLPTTYWSLEN